MRKLLRPQDMLLLGLANVLDLFEEARDPLGIVGKSYENMYGWIPRQYKRHNFNHLVWRNLKTGYIEKVIKDGMPYLRLTSVGKKKVERDFPLLTIQNTKWDRKWRIVIFDIEEVSRPIRERLRYKLREVGFGMLQKSVFISPHDIAKDFTEFIEVLGLSESAYLLEVSNIVVGNIESLVNRVWRVDKINERYRAIIQKIEDSHLISVDDRQKKLNGGIDGGGDKVGDIAGQVWREYLDVILKDPFLPRDLLPGDWQGERARFLIRKIRKIIDK